VGDEVVPRPLDRNVVRHLLAANSGRLRKLRVFTAGDVAALGQDLLRVRFDPVARFAGGAKVGHVESLDNVDRDRRDVVEYHGFAGERAAADVAVIFRFDEAVALHARPHADTGTQRRRDLSLGESGATTDDGDTVAAAKFPGGSPPVLSQNAM